MTSVPREVRDDLKAKADAAGLKLWEPLFNGHADPFVVEKGRGQFGVVCVEVSVRPDDYGRANAEFIAAADPATVSALLQDLDALEADATEQMIDAGVKAAEPIIPNSNGTLWEHVHEDGQTEPVTLRCVVETILKSSREKPA